MTETVFTGSPVEPEETSPLGASSTGNLPVINARQQRVSRKGRLKTRKSDSIKTRDETIILDAKTDVSIRALALSGVDRTYLIDRD